MNTQIPTQPTPEAMPTSPVASLVPPLQLGLYVGEMLCGTSMMVAGGRRRALPGFALALGGVILAMRGVRGLTELARGRQLRRERYQRPEVETTAARDRRMERHFGEAGDRDLVEEASWESFPASDPPSNW